MIGGEPGRVPAGISLDNWLAAPYASARWLAQTVLGLANTLDLSWIQLAGPGFAGTAEVYLAAVRRLLGEASLARGLHPVAVELGGVGPEVAALGAASVVLHSNLTPHHALVARY